eukprot:5371601-Pyramimonas_sp.AAC.1
MGGPFVAQLFRGTFARPLTKWKYALQALDTTATKLTARWRDLRANVGGCTYADDVFQAHLFPVPTPLKDFLDTLRDFDDDLDQKLGEVGYARNPSKQELHMHFHGAGAATCKRRARSHPEFAQGNFKDTVRYLGPMPSINQSVEVE